MGSKAWLVPNFCGACALSWKFWTFIVCQKNNVLQIFKLQNTDKNFELCLNDPLILLIINPFLKIYSKITHKVFQTNPIIQARRYRQDSQVQILAGVRQYNGYTGTWYSVLWKTAPQCILMGKTQIS